MWQSILGFWSANVFAGVSILCFWVELTSFVLPRKIKERCTSHGYSLRTYTMTAQQLRDVTAFMWALSQIIYVACLAPYDTQPAETTDLNADIVGKGIQFGVFVPAASAIVASLLGYFHVSNSGAKELGQAILFTINLCIWWERLRDPEVLIVLISLDCSSSALSMTLVDKEVLSARKLVYCICLVQLFAFGITGYCLSLLASPREPRIWNFRIFWWGYIEYPVSLPHDFSLYVTSWRLQTPWYYYLIKVLTVTSGVVRALAFTQTFNDSKRKSESRPPNLPQTTHQLPQIDLIEPAFEPVRWLGIPIPYIFKTSIASQIDYFKCVATTSTTQLEHIPHIIASILTTISLLKQCRPESGLWIEWGQLAPVGVACLGSIHWLGYTTLLKLLWHERHKFGLVTGYQRFNDPMEEYLRLVDREFAAVTPTYTQPPNPGTQ